MGKRKVVGTKTRVRRVPREGSTTLPSASWRFPPGRTPSERLSLAGCLPLGFLGERILEGTGEVEVNGGMIFGVAKEHEGKF